MRFGDFIAFTAMGTGIALALTGMAPLLPLLLIASPLAYSLYRLADDAPYTSHHHPYAWYSPSVLFGAPTPHHGVHRTTTIRPVHSHTATVRPVSSGGGFLGSLFSRPSYTPSFSGKTSSWSPVRHIGSSFSPATHVSTSFRPFR